VHILNERASLLTCTLTYHGGLLLCSQFPGIFNKISGQIPVLNFRTLQRALKFSGISQQLPVPGLHLHVQDKQQISVKKMKIFPSPSFNTPD